MEDNTPTVPATKRTFPPPYKPTGDVEIDRLAFFHVLERLKTQKRTGWVDHDSTYNSKPSISDHMYRMSVLAMCASDTALDISKCVMMCVVHDLAEAHVGDITPREGIPKGEKRRLETEAMHNFVYEMLHASPAALRIEALWKEYEQGTTDEARFILGLKGARWTAREYEKEHSKGQGELQGFFDSSLPYLRHPEVCQWGEALAREREA
ncbi:HD domain-containing protein [Paxillus ammoniavirescens]|nr:HD domain-containing protein [Paxillus ammoniavirescens]